MGGLAKSFGKILDVAKPVLSAVNPMLGAAAGAVGGLAQGKNPFESILGGLGNIIPGGAGGILQNVLGALGGGGGGGGGGLAGLFGGAGGNNLLSGLLGMVGGKGGVTDLLGGLFKGSESAGGLTDVALKNVQEQAAQKMGSLLGGLFG
jgi:hypothetical protein